MSSSGIDPDKDPFLEPFQSGEIERLRWEQERRNKGGSPGEEPRPDQELNPGLGLFLLVLMGKAFDALKESVRKKLGAAADEQPARTTLSLIKEIIETMMKEDRSQDAQFLKHLSTLWQEILEHSIASHAKSHFSEQLKAFIMDIERYPENTEHTLGYYLDEYAGREWLPFPYMELIQSLHRQHELDPESSFLSRWARRIEEILNNE